MEQYARHASRCETPLWPLDRFAERTSVLAQLDLVKRNLVPAGDADINEEPCVLQGSSIFLSPTPPIGHKPMLDKNYLRPWP